jgi:hypothetical protein
MKKVKSPVEIYRIFRDGTIIKIPDNGEVVCDDTKAAEIKLIYPFVTVEDVLEEKTEEVLQETKTEETKEEVKIEEKTEIVEEKTQKSKRGRKTKKQE